MIKNPRKYKLVKNADMKLILNICLDFFNAVLWDENKKTQILFLTRGRQSQVIQFLNQKVEEAVLKSLAGCDLYKKRGSENFLFESVKRYLAERNAEVVIPTSPEQPIVNLVKERGKEDIDKRKSNNDWFPIYRTKRIY